MRQSLAVGFYLSQYRTLDGDTANCHTNFQIAMRNFEVEIITESINGSQINPIDEILPVKRMTFFNSSSDADGLVTIETIEKPLFILLVKKGIPKIDERVYARKSTHQMTK